MTAKKPTPPPEDGSDPAKPISPPPVTRTATDAEKILSLQRGIEAAKHLLLAATGPEDSPESWSANRDRWMRYFGGPTSSDYAGGRRLFAWRRQNPDTGLFETAWFIVHRGIVLKPRHKAPSFLTYWIGKPFAELEDWAVLANEANSSLKEFPTEHTNAQ